MVVFVDAALAVLLGWRHMVLYDRKVQHGFETSAWRNGFLCRGGILPPVCLKSYSLARGMTAFTEFRWCITFQTEQLCALHRGIQGYRQDI